MALLTWSAAANGALASSATSWGGGIAPATGDDLIFTASSVVTCTMDLAVTVSSLIVTSAYTGVIQCISALTVSSGIVLGGQ